MGLTGIIVEVTIKVLKLKSTYLKKKTIKFSNLLAGYHYLKKSKNLYNQNNSDYMYLAFAESPFKTATAR